MGFALVDAVYTSDAGNSATSMTTDTGGTSGALNVAAGDLLVACFGCDDSAGSGNWSVVGDGNNSAGWATHTGGDKNHNSDVSGQMFWKLSAVADASEKFVWSTDGDGRAYKGFVVFQFRPDSGEEVSVDDEDVSGAGSDDTSESAAITTAGTDVVVVSMVKHYSSPASDTYGYNGSNNEDGSQSTGDYFAAWYKMSTADSYAQSTGFGTNSWVSPIAAFKSAAVGGNVGPTHSFPLGMNHGIAIRMP